MRLGQCLHFKWAKSPICAVNWRPRVASFWWCTILATVAHIHTHTHTHTTIIRPSCISSRTTRVSWHQKGKTSLDLLEQEIVSGSGISWAICKSAPWPRHITMPASHHSVFTTRCTIVQSVVLLSHVICPSVTLVNHDHIGWKSWKLIAQTISPTSSLFIAQRSYHLLPGEHGENFGRLEVGREKLACWSTKMAVSLKRVKIEEKLLWRAYRKSPSHFWMIPSTTPLWPPLPLN